MARVVDMNKHQQIVTAFQRARGRLNTPSTLPHAGDDGGEAFVNRTRVRRAPRRAIALLAAATP